MSFPIPITRAVGGALVAGDRVDVLSVRHNSGRSSYVAMDATVLAFAPLFLSVASEPDWDEDAPLIVERVY